MVTSADNTNTIAFPEKKESQARRRVIDIDKHTGLRLQLSNVLQTTLDLPQVLQLFFEEAQNALPLGSLSYNFEKISQPIELGKSGKHSCHYKLTTQQSNLGELVFTRSKRFAERELQLLEMLISCLIFPMRNALLYRDAVQTALQDPLTGAGNRTALEATLEREIGLAKRHEQALSILVLDIDKFKLVNDTHGHTAGDCVLKDVSRHLAQCCRDTDALFRFGGEEFVMILNKTSQQGAAIIAERLRCYVEEISTAYQDNVIDVTMSIGVATLLPNDTISSLFTRADKALYSAKKNGRNQVVLAEQSDAATVSSQEFLA